MLMAEDGGRLPEEPHKSRAGVAMSMMSMPSILSMSLTLQLQFCQLNGLAAIKVHS